jgi:hypothetical protein
LVSSEEYPTLSIIWPYLTILKESLKESNFSEASINKIKENVITEINARFKEPSNLMLVSMFLDPRFKIRFMTSEQVEKTKKILHSFSYDLTLYSKGVPSSTSSQQQLPRDSIIEKLNNFQNSSPPNTNSSIEKEIENYLELPCLPFFKILVSCNYWKNETQFKILKLLARKYLCIPASSVTVERIFSELGNIMTLKRCNMDAETLQILGFLYHNLDEIEFLKK